MDDAPKVSAFWLDCKRLEVECPFCSKIHYHCAKRSPHNDVREANRLQRHFPKKLRGQKLYYRLHRVRGPCEESGAAIAAANGHAPSAPFMKSWEETFSQPDSQYSTSMLRDIERGGQTEVEHILGFMLNKALKAQISCNTLLLAYTSVKAFEQRRAAGRLP